MLYAEFPLPFLSPFSLFSLFLLGNNYANSLQNSRVNAMSMRNKNE